MRSVGRLLLVRIGLANGRPMVIVGRRTVGGYGPRRVAKARDGGHRLPMMTAEACSHDSVRSQNAVKSSTGCYVGRNLRDWP
jgi:hypothetical protein